MSTVSGTFDAVGVSSTLNTGNKGENITISISGTYAQTLQVERERGSPGSGAWEPVWGPYSTASASHDATYVTREDNERLRVRCTSDTSGTSTYSISDGDRQNRVVYDDEGNKVITDFQSGRTHHTPVTFQKAVTVNEQTPNGSESTFMGEFVDVVKGRISLATKFRIFDDFEGTWAIGDAGPADKWVAGTGTDTSNGAEGPTTVANAPSGRITLTTSTADGGIEAKGAAIATIGLPFEAEEGELYAEGYFKLSDVSEAFFFFGFTDVAPSGTLEESIFLSGSATLDSDAANACGVVLDKNSTKSYFYAGGVKGTTDTTPVHANDVTPSDNVFFKVQVRVSTTGVLHAWVNGTKITPDGGVAAAVTATTNLCGIASVGVRSGNQVILTVDYLEFMQDRSSAAS